MVLGPSKKFQKNLAIELCPERNFKGTYARIIKKYDRLGLPGHSIIKNEI